MTAGDSKQVTVRLPTPLVDVLERFAESDYRTLSQEIRRALDLYVKWVGAEAKREVMREDEE